MARKQNAERAQPQSLTGSSGDRFDSVVRSRRVGAHRIVARPRRLWFYLLAGFVAVVLLTGGGMVAVHFMGASVTNLWEEEVPPPPPAPVVKPELDPTAEVVVLNGTSMPGFGAIIDAIITENEWGQILFSTEAASNTVEISAVFYASVADEAAALGLAKELGGVSVYQSYEYSQQYGARLVVLLGADYGGPGSDQLVLADPSPAVQPEEMVGEDQPAEDSE